MYPHQFLLSIPSSPRLPGFRTGAFDADELSFIILMVGRTEAQNTVSLSRFIITHKRQARDTCFEA